MAVVAFGRVKVSPVAVKLFGPNQFTVVAEDVAVPTNGEPEHAVGMLVIVKVGIVLTTNVIDLVVVQPFTAVTVTV